MSDITSTLTEIHPDGPEPDILQLIVTVYKENDTISVSQCRDPQFDLDVLTEALASLILINGKYTEKAPSEVLKAVHSKLLSAVKFHDNIMKSE